MFRADSYFRRDNSVVRKESAQYQSMIRRLARDLRVEKAAKDVIAAFDNIWYYTDDNGSDQPSLAELEGAIEKLEQACKS
jgi:hypothetical protein